MMELSNVQSYKELDALYLSLLTNIKSGGPIWEDIISKGGKLFTALRATVHASNAFLDAIQRLADLASKTSGGSKEVGAHFTRLCMRQKRLGTKVKTMGNQLITCMVNPLSSHVEEWKKTLANIEKEHNREAKRARGELKRALSEANRLKRKLAKQGSTGTLHSRQSSAASTIGHGVGLGEPPISSRLLSSTASSGVGTSSLAVRTELAVKTLEEKIRRMEYLERATIKKLMLEERGRFCFFFSCMRPVLETETSLLSEISTLRELFIALSAATEDPSCLLEEAESVLTHAGTVVDGAALVSPSGPLHSIGTNEVEAFASAVDAIMSGRQRQQSQAHARDEGTPSLASESLGSTSSRWTGSDGGGSCVGGSGAIPSPDSSQVSVYSIGSGTFAPHQMPAILKQPRVQNEIGPRSASVGRPTINGTLQHVVSCGGTEEVILRRPTIDGTCVTSPPARQRPQTTTAKDTSSRYTTSVTSVESSSNHRHSTCTLQQLNGALIPQEGEMNEAKADINETNGDEEEDDEEEEEETASGTVDDETSDEGVLSDERRLSNGESERTIGGEGEIQQSPHSNILTSENRSLSRGGDLQTMLYPDQSLPPPVYTNLNKLTHAAQRKFSMSTTVSPNTPTISTDVGPVTSEPINEGDNLSIASAPQVQSEQTANNGGIYSVPGSPHRPSFSTSSSNSRPRGSSVGIEDPFSLEMDELDRMVTGSSAASSVTSRSGRSGSDHPSQPHSHPLVSVSHSTGIPAGLLRHPTSPDGHNGTASRRDRSRSSSFCASTGTSIPGGIEGSATTTDSPVAQFIPHLQQSINSMSQSPGSRHNINSVEVDDRAIHVSSTAASLLTQLSGQLQQLNSFNTAALLKHPPSTDVHSRKESGEFDLPAPPSPDMLDVY